MDDFYSLDEVVYSLFNENGYLYLTDDYKGFLKSDMRDGSIWIYGIPDLGWNWAWGITPSEMLAPYFSIRHSTVANACHRYFSSPYDATGWIADTIRERAMDDGFPFIP